MIEFANFSLLAILFASIVVILAAAEIGHQLGLRVAGEANISTLEAAILGLLALMISFTFAMSLTRFDARRDALLNEANSIGTAALRARLLPAPHDTESLKLLRDYVQIRLDFSRRAEPPAEASAVIAHSNEIQEVLWAQAMVVATRDHAMVPAGIYIQALNEMFDNQEKRLTAWRNRVPDIVLFALYAIAVVAIGFTGYAGGQEARRWRLPVYIMSILVATVILLIQDIDRPSAGFITVSQQPMIDAAASLDGYIAGFEKRVP
jgi:membrane protein YdbS with pleckstrin-like domain